MFRRRWRALQSVDEMIGEIIRTLEELNQLEQTFIVYTSDHGQCMNGCAISLQQYDITHDCIQ